MLVNNEKLDYTSDLKATAFLANVPQLFKRGEGATTCMVEVRTTEPYLIEKQSMELDHANWGTLFILCKQCGRFLYMQQQYGSVSKEKALCIRDRFTDCR